jgi:hypothetical protein
LVRWQRRRATFDNQVGIDSFTAGTLSIAGGNNAILDDVSGFDAVIGVSGLLTFSALDASETLKPPHRRSPGWVAL